MSIPAPTAAEGARWAARQAVHRVAGELADNRDITVWRRIEGLAIPMHDVAPEWGLQAALFLCDFATAAISDYLALARGQGSSWDRIGELLGLADEAREHDVPCGEAAFAFVVQHRRPGQRVEARWRRARWLRWTCGICGQRVTDTGPFEADPDDCEAGHAPDCSRHGGARDAYQRAQEAGSW